MCALALVTDSSLEVMPGPGLTVLHRPRVRRGWGALAIDDALERVAGIEGAVLVLAPHPAADPGAAGLADVAAAVGADLVLVPDQPAQRRFLVAVARRWVADGTEGVVGRLWTLSAALSQGCDGDTLTGLGARALAGWAYRGARPCRWCRGGRGAPGGPCGRCGDCHP